MEEVILRTFTEEEYHRFFMHYRSDPMMDPTPFRYSREQISRSYAYNHDAKRTDYAHFGIFVGDIPVGSFQLKRMDFIRKTCEFGIILQDDSVKNRGIGSSAIASGMSIARDIYGMRTITGDTMGRNLRMRHIFEKLGFRLTETIPQSFELPDGQKEDRLVYCKSLTEE